MLSDEGLRKHERITEQHEYKTVIGNGRLVYSRAFKVHFLTGKDLERRAGFIAGKGVGGACERNRARRVLREAYRRLKPRLLARGFKVGFGARQDAAHAGSRRIQAEMERILDKCGLLKEEEEE